MLLQDQIRHGTSPDNPTLISLFLRTCEEHALELAPEQRASVYRRAYRLLLETICDSHVPRHWRCTCLDHIYRPVFALNKLAVSEAELKEVAHCYREVNLLGHYFLGATTC